MAACNSGMTERRINTLIESGTNVNDALNMTPPLHVLLRLGFNLNCTSCGHGDICTSCYKDPLFGEAPSPVHQAREANQSVLWDAGDIGSGYDTAGGVARFEDVLDWHAAGQCKLPCTVDDTYGCIPPCRKVKQAVFESEHHGEGEWLEMGGEVCERRVGCEDRGPVWDQDHVAVGCRKCPGTGGDSVAEWGPEGGISSPISMWRPDDVPLAQEQEMLAEQGYRTAMIAEAGGDDVASGNNQLRDARARLNTISMVEVNVDRNSVATCNQDTGGAETCQAGYGLVGLPGMRWSWCESCAEKQDATYGTGTHYSQDNVCRVCDGIYDNSVATCNPVNGLARTCMPGFGLLNGECESCAGKGTPDTHYSLNNVCVVCPGIDDNSVATCDPQTGDAVRCMPGFGFVEQNENTGSAAHCESCEGKENSIHYSPGGRGSCLSCTSVMVDGTVVGTCNNSNGNATECNTGYIVDYTMSPHSCKICVAQSGCSSDLGGSPSTECIGVSGGQEYMDKLRCNVPEPGYYVGTNGVVSQCQEQQLCERHEETCITPHPARPPGLYKCTRASKGYYVDEDGAVTQCQQAARRGGGWGGAGRRRSRAVGRGKSGSGAARHRRVETS